MPEYHPSQITDAILAAHYAAQSTPYGLHYRIRHPMQGYPNAFYESERSAAQEVIPSQPRIHISIAVYVGEPLDYQKYRHTALCLRPDNGETAMIVHIVGPNRAYQLETRDNYEPTTSRSFAKEVQVGWMSTRTTKTNLARLISQTPIDNSSHDFDCQKWVAATLERLATAGSLTAEECRNGIDGMVDATMEATEDPQ